MTTGDTLLKIADYPFAYSIGFVIISILGYNISDEKALPFLALAGFVGTFLAIVDPFGWAVRAYFMIFARTDFRKKRNSQIVDKWDYIQSAFYTNSINFEKDKIVSIVYFVIVLFIFLIALYYDSFAKRLIIENNVINCNLDCVRTYYPPFLTITAIIIGIKLIWNGIKLSKKADIVATYLFSLSSQDVSKESVESISRFIELGDWTTAKYWQDKVREDIANKKGKRELIIRASETVYAPIHVDLVRIEEILKSVEKFKTYSRLNFKSWNNVKKNLLHLAITNKKFVKIADEFEIEANEFDPLVETTIREAFDIIRKYASQVFKMQATSVTYDINGKGGMMSVELRDSARCAIFNLHPTDVQPDSNLIRVRFTIIDAGPKEIILDQNQMKDFDNKWQDIVLETNELESVKRIRKLYEMLSTKVKILREICEEENQLKYKVF